MSKSFWSKVSVILAIGFMFCLTFNVLATDATVKGATTSQTAPTKQDKKISKLQKDITIMQQKISEQQKKITNMTNNSAKPKDIAKEQKKLDKMNKDLTDRQAKLTKLGGSMPAPAAQNQ